MSQNNENKKPMVENISCILPEHPELGGLFLGNVFGAQNAAILKEYGIRAMITASIETNINHPFEDIPFHLKLQAHDKEDYYIIEHVNECIHFIEQKRKLTNVYVHCYAGVSRSSAIVVAYLMWKYRWPLEKTLNFLVHKRIVAKPNVGFMRQLKQVEGKLNINPQQSKPKQTNGHQQNTVTIKQKISVKPKYPHQQQVTMNESRSNSYSAKPNVMSTKPLSPPLNHQNINNLNNMQPQHYNAQQNADRQDYSMSNGELILDQKQFSQRVNNQERANIKQYPSHNNIPIPKVLQKKMSNTKKISLYQNDYEVKDMENTKKVPYNYPSTQIPTSPRDRKIHLVNNDYYNRYPEQSKGYLNNLNNNSLNNTNKKMGESQQKGKMSSRCIIRPKDLPGYKHY